MPIPFKNWLFDTEIKKTWVKTLVLFLYGYLAYPVWFKFEEDFDPAFKLAITDGLRKGLVFGIENSSGTYGALGFLTNRLPTSAVFPIIILFDVLLCGLIIYVATRFGEGKLTPWAIILTLFCLLNIGFQYDNYIVLLPILQLAILSNRRNKGAKTTLLDGLVISLVSVLAFFIKSSFGMFMLPISLLSLVFVGKASLREALICSLFGLMALLGIGYITRTDILATVLETIAHFQGYNSAMVHYADNTSGEIKVLTIILTQIAVLIWAIYQITRQATVEKIFLMGMVGLYAFLQFKSSIVRADPLHLNYFISFIPLLILFVEPHQKHLLVQKPFAVILLVIGFALIGSHQIGAGNTKFRRYVPYVNSFFQTEAEIKATAIRKCALIDGNMLKIIGQQSITCIPNSYSIVSLQPNINFTNIPTVQALYNYNQFLDSINADFYQKQKSDFILEHPISKDPIQSLAMENKGFVTRKQHYVVAAYDSNYVLLSKRTKPLSVNYLPLATDKPLTGSEFSFSIDPKKTTEIRFSFQSGWKKKIQSLIYKYPNVWVTVHYSDTSITKAVGYSILERGILVIPIGEDTKSLENRYILSPKHTDKQANRLTIDFKDRDIHNIRCSINEVVFGKP